MTSVRPTSVCDTTPLQRLESQSSSSEPSSPTLNGNGLSTQGSESTASTTAGSHCSKVGGVIPVSNKSTPSFSKTTTTTTTTPQATTTNTTLLLANNHNNNKIEIDLNNFMKDTRREHSQQKPLQQQQQQNNRIMDFYKTRNVFGRIFLDLMVLSCVGLPILGFSMYGKTYKRGFFCDDVSLKLPYKESTVHSWMLYLMGLAIPIMLILTVEFYKSNNNKMRGFGNLSADRYYCCNLEIADWIVECYKKIGMLIFGAGVVQLTSYIAKYSIGRLRPHFFAVCQPILFDGTTCDHAINAGRYIENFTCRGVDVKPSVLKNVRLSFPSGHATFAFFTMLYMAIYLQKRMTWRRGKMLKHLLQLFFLMFAWYTALTRVADYKHHWTDVLAGSAIGTIYALAVTLTMW